MLFEVEIEEAPARFAEMMATIAAGYGVLIRRGDVILARLVPEAAFHAPAEPEIPASEAQEMLEAFQAAMNDSF